MLLYPAHLTLVMVLNKEEYCHHCYLLFHVFLDELISLLREQGVGCHMNGMFVEAFCYADDVTLLAPTGMTLNAMLDICTRFADAHNLLFNSSSTKCMYIDRSCRNYTVMFDLWVDLLSL